MFGLFKTKENKDKSTSDKSELEQNENKETKQEESSVSILQKLRQGLKKTKTKISDSIANLVFGKKEIDAELLEELEATLITADLGPNIVDTLLNDVKEKLSRKELLEPSKLIDTLRASMLKILTSQQTETRSSANEEKPHVILVIGVNGAGKTTTIGKISNKLKAEGKSVMLAAGDTFRAAAVEQLQAWGERTSIPVIAQHTGADSASVLHDALTSAKKKNIDVLIADTAGRLHSKNDLMEELQKIKRVIKKIDPHAPHETMLIIDGSMGLNAIAQARVFNEKLKIDSIAITKLDGTAKGGAVLSISEELKLPIKYIGVGEKVEDLQEFEPAQFIKALI